MPIYWFIRNSNRQRIDDNYNDKYNLNPTWNKFDAEKIDTNETLKNRIEICNDNEIFDLLESINYFKGKPSRPKSGNLDSTLVSQLDSLSRFWPIGLQKIVQKNVYRIYLVKDLNALGRTIQISGERFIIFLDESTFQKKPNSIYKFPNSEDDFEVWKIEEDTMINSNSIKYCVENTMIHELGHCVGSLFGVTPHLNRQIDMFYHFPFFDSLYSARINFESVADEYYKLEEIEYPKEGQKFQFENIVSLFHLWEKSPFPTFYSIQGPYEVFAEYFYCYYHNNIQNKPFHYEIYKDKKLVWHFVNRIDNKLETERYKTIEKIFVSLKEK